MSKYQITHTCGHTVEHAIAGTNVHGERERRAEYLAKQVCTECYRRQQHDAAATATADLPALTGSDKQVAWATTLRAAAVKNLRATRDLVQPFADNGNADAVHSISIINAVLAQAQAKYWIDNRDVTFDRRWLASQLTK